MGLLAQSLVASLDELSAAGRMRIRRTVEHRTAGSVHVRVDGTDLLAFCSNDYLGLADHPRVVAEFVAAAKEWGVGSGDRMFEDRLNHASLLDAGLEADDVPILMGTLGKAFGTFGAFVTGPEELVGTLLQKARTYICTTALPPAVAAATRAALRVIQDEPWRRERVLEALATVAAAVAEARSP